MDKTTFNKMWKAFTGLGKEAFKASHYALAEETTIKDTQLWKEFLMTPEVSEFIQEETRLLQEAEFRTILLNTDKDASAGRAQLLNAFMNVSNKDKRREGPTVIYSYVPLNAQQMKADNVTLNNKDIFRK